MNTRPRGLRRGRVGGWTDRRPPAESRPEGSAQSMDGGMEIAARSTSSQKDSRWFLCFSPTMAGAP
eukprot:COSAG03_NODE_22561_length_289_cov_1.147368_1_plen_65_part_01